MFFPDQIPSLGWGCIVLASAQSRRLLTDVAPRCVVALEVVGDADEDQHQHFRLVFEVDPACPCNPLRLLEPDVVVIMRGQGWEV